MVNTWPFYFLRLTVTSINFTAGYLTARVHHVQVSSGRSYFKMWKSKVNRTVPRPKHYILMQSKSGVRAQRNAALTWIGIATAAAGKSVAPQALAPATATLMLRAAGAARLSSRYLRPAQQSKASDRNRTKFTRCRRRPTPEGPPSRRP